ncbi:putative spermidine/putrescine transport system substrate-binding protein [Stella humosa]|uniref:Putative spermidine/putrescine transport system substrate-binding protein n=1 Tax=Stella humosa TaxID=94 RepID=A0A3N1KU52_9PROT|nr:extracellular solute-binding protein [Stella humosa]ROP83514.1 putative spermidine/putrescine transport system substrate-binding protein [Stella humosa]BBK33213.1 ABC transporter substrate-binding protein [Stella humosa]
MAKTKNGGADSDIARPGLARRGFIGAAGTAALSLTALGHVGREAQAAAFRPDLTMAENPNPASAYPKWFPSWPEVEKLARQEGQVLVSAWGSAEAKEMFTKLCAQFEKKYGIKAVYRHGDWFAAQQQVLNDVKEKKEQGSIDAIFLWGKPFSNLMQGGGVWEVPILDMLPNARRIAYRPELGRFVHDMVPTYGCFVPQVNYQNCFVYDKKKFKKTDMPQTVEGVLDWAKKNKGQFTYCDVNKGGSGHTWVMMLIYALTGGYEKYAFKPFNKDVAANDWKPLWDYLKELEQYMYRPGTYPQGNNAVAQLFSAEEITFCPNWDGTMAQEVRGGRLDPDRLGVFVPEPGIFSPCDGFTIPTNAPHKAAALLFLDYILSVEAQMEVPRIMASYPVVTEAWDRLPAKERNEPWVPVQDLRQWRDLGRTGARHGEYMFQMMTEWVDRIARR